MQYNEVLKKNYAVFLNRNKLNYHLSFNLVVTYISLVKMFNTSSILISLLKKTCVSEIRPTEYCYGNKSRNSIFNW